MLNIERIEDYGPLLKKAQNIAVVGLSPKTVRPSNMVARYLLGVGYDVYPVNPGHDEILGRKCYRRLLDVPVSIDIVNIFRRSEDVLPVVEEAVEIGAQAIWMQQAIVNHQAAELAQKHGLTVIMDRCIKIEHQNLQLASR